MTTGERRRLLAHAEHELRGALAAIALEAPHVDLARARAALADLEAARRGARRPDDALVRVDAVVWRAATRADLAARRLGGRVRLDWRAGEVRVPGDRDRLAQALDNLLDNAIEHGGAEVTVTGRRAHAGVQVVVRDGGPAPPRPQATIALMRLAAGLGDRAAPAPAPAPDRGHGLAIAAAGVRACGGVLKKTAAPGGGTAVAIELPLTR